MLYIPKDIEEEGNRLAEGYFNAISDDEFGEESLSNYINENASDTYKKWYRESCEYREKKLKQGIRI